MTKQQHITKLQLYRIRKVHGLTLKEMGAILGVSHVYIHRVESGEDRMTERMQRKVIEAFDLNPNKMRAITQTYLKFQVKENPIKQQQKEEEN